MLLAPAMFIAALAAFPKNRALVIGVYGGVWVIAHLSLTLVTARRRR